MITKRIPAQKHVIRSVFCAKGLLRNQIRSVMSEIIISQ